ncbi:MAG: hypothetical protein LBU87_03115 [Lactobacillales bacterium]|jgi:hypothetical protein|nr:hypothetical protein [Lactobacillales bacterium]
MKSKNDYYKEHSDYSKISKKFAEKIGKKPVDIITKIRHLMVHPCECKYHFSAQNWPGFRTAIKIENEFETQKLVAGKCREFTLLCVAVLRSYGIPARSRCGFATYFTPGFFEDHWILEYWDKKWYMADAQTNRFCVKRGEFITGTVAWQLYRQYGFSPDLFGFSGNKEVGGNGVYYIIANMIRDLSGLMKEELEYPEKHPLMEEAHKLTPADIKLLDKIADLIVKDDTQKLKTIYKNIKKDIVNWKMCAHD